MLCLFSELQSKKINIINLNDQTKLVTSLGVFTFPHFMTSGADCCCCPCLSLSKAGDSHFIQHYVLVRSKPSTIGWVTMLRHPEIQMSQKHIQEYFITWVLITQSMNKHRWENTKITLLHSFNSIKSVSHFSSGVLTQTVHCNTRK